MNFLEKLDYLKNKYNLNNHTLAQASGIPYTTIDGFYKKDYKNIKLGTLQRVANYFNVSLDYLIRDEIEDPNYDKAFNMELDSSEITLLEKFRAISPHAQETIRILIDREYDGLVDKSTTE